MPESSFYDWMNRGLELGRANHYEEALKAFDQAIELDERFASAWHNKGNALNGLGRHKEALKVYDKAIALDESFADSWNGKGVALRNLDRHEEALKAYDKAIELDKSSADSWNGRGNALRNLDRHEEALKAYDKAIELDESYAHPWNGKGNALNGLGRHKEALKAYDKAIELDKSLAAQPWNGKGLALSGLGRFHDARRAYKHYSCLVTRSDVKKVNVNLLEEFYQDGLQAPLLLLRLVARIPDLLVQPGWFEAICDLGQVFVSHLACLEMLHVTDDGAPDQLRLRAKGCLAFHLGDPAFAEESFDTLDDLYPEDLLGQYYLVSSRYDYWADISACLPDAVNAALAYHGSDPEQAYYAARILNFAGKDQDASKFLRKAGQYVPALFLRFDMAREKNDITKMKDLARQILEKEKAADPEWRFLRPIPPGAFDVTSRDWLAAIVRFAGHMELSTEIKGFLERLDDPAFFDLRHTYASVLKDTHLGAWDLKTSLKLNEASQKQLDRLLSERNKAALAELRAELEAEDVNVGRIEAMADNKLEALLARRLEDEKTSLQKERWLNAYLYGKKRLTVRASVTLMFYSIVREGRPSPEHIKAACMDACLGGTSSLAGVSLTTLGITIFGISMPASLITVLGTSVLTGIASLLYRKVGSRAKALPKDDIDRTTGYLSFREELKTASEKGLMDLPESFWTD